MCTRIATCLLGLLLVVGLAAPTDARSKFEFPQFADSAQRTFLSFDMSYRLDSREDISPQASLGLVLTHWVHSGIALKLEGHFNNRISYASNAQVRSYRVGGGLWLQSGSRLVNPFMELDASVQVVRGEQRQYKVREAALGLGGGIGLSLRMSSSQYLDVGVHQVLSLYFEEVFIASPPLPDDDFPPMWPSWASSKSELFNPAHLFVRYRIGL